MGVTHLAVGKKSTVYLIFGTVGVGVGVGVGMVKKNPFIWTCFGESGVST